jgi:hypothetical protein
MRHSAVDASLPTAESAQASFHLTIVASGTTRRSPGPDHHVHPPLLYTSRTPHGSASTFVVMSRQPCWICASSARYTVCVHDVVVPSLRQTSMIPADLLVQWSEASVLHCHALYSCGGCSGAVDSAPTFWQNQTHDKPSTVHSRHEAKEHRLPSGPEEHAPSSHLDALLSDPKSLSRLLVSLI